MMSPFEMQKRGIFMKKITALLLFAALAFSLCACSPARDGKKEKTESSETSVTEKSETTVKDSSETTAKDSSDAAVDTEKPETTADETTESTETTSDAETNAITEETSAEENTAPFEPGEVTDNTYTSQYFGFGCKFGEDWDILVSDPKINESDSEVSYEMTAQNADNTESVRIVIKNMGTAGAESNEKSYLNSQSDSLKESLEASGAENVSIKLTPVEFADDFHYALSAVGETNGKSMEEYVIAVQRGTYFANVIIHTLNGNTEELISSFFAVD